jgi:hypothetical protein
VSNSIGKKIGETNDETRKIYKMILYFITSMIDVLMIVLMDISLIWNWTNMKVVSIMEKV